MDKSVDLKVHQWRNPALVDILYLCYQRFHLLTYSYWHRERNQYQSSLKAQIHLCLWVMAEAKKNSSEKMWKLSHQRGRRLWCEEIHSILILLYPSLSHYCRCLASVFKGTWNRGKRRCNHGALKRDFLCLCKMLKNVNLWSSVHLPLIGRYFL